MKKIKSEEYSANLGTEKCFQIKDELHQWNPRYTSGLYTNYVFIFFRTDRVVFVACDFSMYQIFLVQVRRKKSTLSEVKLAVIGAPGVGKSGLCFFLLQFLSRKQDIWCLNGTFITWFLLGYSKYFYRVYIHIHLWKRIVVQDIQPHLYETLSFSLDSEIFDKAIHRRV